MSAARTAASRCSIAMPRIVGAGAAEGNASRGQALLLFAGFADCFVREISRTDFCRIGPRLVGPIEPHDVADRRMIDLGLRLPAWRGRNDHRGAELLRRNRALEDGI